jgi:hypothetical protein
VRWWVLGWTSHPSTRSFSTTQATRSLILTLPLVSRVVDPYSFFTDPDPDPEFDVGDQYGSGSKSGSGSNTDLGLK